MAYSWKIAVVVLAVILAVTSARLVGGWSAANMNDQMVKDALQMAVVEHNKRSNDIFVSQVSRIVKAQKQVVAGMKYQFTVEMTRTECRKHDSQTVCGVHPDADMAKPYICKFDVYTRPWENYYEVKNDCSP